MASRKNGLAARWRVLGSEFLQFGQLLDDATLQIADQTWLRDAQRRALWHFRKCVGRKVLPPAPWLVDALRGKPTDAAIESCFLRLAGAGQRNGDPRDFLPWLLKIHDYCEQQAQAVERSVLERRQEAVVQAERSAIAAPNALDAAENDTDGIQSLAATPRRRMPIEETEMLVTRLLRDKPEFQYRTIREWASEIGCSRSQIAKTQTWRECQKRRGKSRSVRAKSIGDPDVISTKAKAADLAQLVAEQTRDDEADSRKRRRR